MAKNGLNYLTKDEQEKLGTKEQKPQIINFFKFIYVIFNIDYSNISDEEIIPNFIKNILPNELKHEDISN